MRHLALLTCIGILASGPVSACTWYVEPDSTGSASVIQAAIDSASVGDTVLVGPGSYMVADDTEGWISAKSGVALVGEQGAEATEIVVCDASVGIFLIGCEGARVSGFRCGILTCQAATSPLGGSVA
jgi:hypothetical protein